MTNREMIENGRAEYAYNTVSKFVEETNDQKAREKYRTRIITMPMMIKTNGFGTTMAFYFSKNNSQEYYRLAYEHIEEWLMQQKYLENSGNVMQKITSSSIDDYKLMMNETMALLEWMKRFVEGLIKVEKSADNQVHGE